MLRRRISKKKKAEAAAQPIDPSTIPEAKPPAPDPVPPVTGDVPVSPEAVSPQLPGPQETLEVPAGPDVAGAPPAAPAPPAPGEADIPEAAEAEPEMPNEPAMPVIPDEGDRPSTPTPESPAPDPAPPAPEGDPAPDPGPAIPEPSPGLPTEPAEPEPAPDPPSPSPEPPSPAPEPPAPEPDPAPVPPARATFVHEPLPDPTPPPTRATLPPSSPLATQRVGTMVGGIDLGGTKIAAAVIGPGHEVISYRRRPTPDRGGPADVVRAMAITMQEAARDAGLEAHQLRAVGVGSPGSVESTTGAVSGAGNLPGWDGRFQLGMALREAIGTPVAVSNDVQVGTNAEYQLGAGAGFSSLLGVFWGTGVGGGVILDGKPWKGRGRAGEIGHTLVRRGGAKGLNGLNGTVEAYAGRKAMEAKAIREMKKGRESDLFKIMEKHGKTHLTSAIWAHALDHGDELATELLNRAVKALSAGIASAVNLLDVEAVVIGGGLGVRFADSLVQEIIDGMGQYLLNPDNPPAIRVAGLGDEGGVLGASLLVS